jgi:hypothetical protein
MLTIIQFTVVESNKLKKRLTFIPSQGGIEDLRRSGTSRAPDIAVQYSSRGQALLT